MNAAIVILTLDSELSRVVGIKKTFFIPSDLRSRYPRLSIISYLATVNTTIDDLCAFFSSVGKDGLIVLCDNRLGHFVNDLAAPFFTVVFDHAFGGKILQNYFWMILSKTIKSFATFTARFDDTKTRKLLILPLRNFSADEIRHLHGLFRNGVNANGAFNAELDRLLGSLRQRQKPKIESTYRTTYLVDDDQKYFEYGHEVHAPLETKVPPHNRMCALAGLYRFGKRYESKRHFNVSTVGNTIEGTFHDCHGSSSRRGPITHINMFPNDFFG